MHVGTVKLGGLAQPNRFGHADNNADHVCANSFGTLPKMRSRGSQSAINADEPLIIPFVVNYNEDMQEG